MRFLANENIPLDALKRSENRLSFSQGPGTFTQRNAARQICAVHSIPWVSPLAGLEAFLWLVRFSTQTTQQ